MSGPWRKGERGPVPRVLQMALNFVGVFWFGALAWLDFSLLPEPHPGRFVWHAFMLCMCGFSESLNWRDGSWPYTGRG